MSESLRTAGNPTTKTDIPEIDWTMANCRNPDTNKPNPNSELFSPAPYLTSAERQDLEIRAKVVCQRCTQLYPCLLTGIDNKEEGIWGGATQRERSRIDTSTLTRSNVHRVVFSKEVRKQIHEAHEARARRRLEWLESLGIIDMATWRSKHSV